MFQKIVLCDDEQTVHCRLADYLRQMQEETGKTFELTHLFSGEELLTSMPPDADILLLDIQMGSISGIDAARKIREKRPELIIILITNLVDYALEGYEIHAFSFLCKPVSYANFRRCLLEAFKMQGMKQPSSIVISSAGRSTKINLDEILYVEVYHHATTFVSANGKAEFTVPLSEIETMTADKGFFRCHMSYLVNMKHVKKILPSSLIMENSDEVPLSKHRRKDFLSAYSVYAGARL